MMNLIKKILLVGGIGIVAFPILLIALMFAQGVLHVAKGPKQVEKKEEVEVLKYSPIQDSMAVVHSKTYQSLLAQEVRLNAQKRTLGKKEEQIQVLEKELEEKAKAIEAERRRIEEIVKSSHTLEEKRIKALAQIYGAMRPEEAAPLMETLPDQLAIAILKAIDEDTQKAKIIEKMSIEKASRISKIMGASIFAKKVFKDTTAKAKTK